MGQSEVDALMIFVPITLSLLCGYLVILLGYGAGMYLITRLGRQYLMTEDSLSGTYFLLLSLVWFIISLLSGYVTFSFAPLPPYGPHIFCAVMAFVSAAIVFRDDRELPAHQPVSVTLTLFVVIAAGFAAGDLLHLQA